jgi:hypothetical protein
MLFFSTIPASNHIIIGIKTFLDALYSITAHVWPMGQTLTCPRAMIEYKAL